jgi:hypothetical protein
MYFSSMNGILEKEALEATSRVSHLALDMDFFVNGEICDPMPFDVFPLCFKGLGNITILMPNPKLEFDPVGGFRESDCSRRQRESVVLQFAAASSRMPEWKLPVLKFRGCERFQANPLD